MGSEMCIRDRHNVSSWNPSPSANLDFHTPQTNKESRRTPIKDLLPVGRCQLSQIQYDELRPRTSSLRNPQRQHPRARATHFEQRRKPNKLSIQYHLTNPPTKAPPSCGRPTPSSLKCLPHLDPRPRINTRQGPSKHHKIPLYFTRKVQEPPPTHLHTQHPANKIRNSLPPRLQRGSLYNRHRAR